MLRSSAVVAFISAVGSLLSLANQLVIARLFGASTHMDAYFIAISAPMMLASVVGGVLSYSMVPMLMQHEKGMRHYEQFAGTMFVAIGSLAVGIALLGSLAAPTLITVLSPDLIPDVRGETVAMAEYSWMGAGLVLISSYLSAMENASRRFTTPAIASTLPTMGMIGLTLMSGHENGPLTLVWGMLAGQALAIPLLLRRAISELEISRAGLVFLVDAIRYMTRMPLAGLAMLLFTAYPLIDAYWAPSLGPSNLAYLSYCQRILNNIGTILIAGPAAVLSPRLSQAFVQGRHDEYLSDVARAARMVLVHGGAVALMISIVSAPMVQLLFQRGAFDSRATQGVASILPLMMLGMTGMLCVVVLFRALFARRALGAGALFGGAATGIYFALSGVFSYQFHIMGVALAYVLTWWCVLVATVWWLWRNHIGHVLSIQNLHFLGKFGAILVVAGAVEYLVNFVMAQAVKEVGAMGLAMRLAACVGAFSVCFYGVGARLLWMPEVTALVFLGRDVGTTWTSRLLRRIAPVG